MQIEFLVGLTGLLLMGAALARGSAALAMSVYVRRREERADRRMIEAMRGGVQRHAEPLERSTPVSVARPPERHQPSDTAPIKLVVSKRVYENATGDVCSFYLSPSDGRPLPPFSPGQFLTFTFGIAGVTTPTSRCYSLSMHPANPHEFYRISVKRLMPSPAAGNGAPPGLISNCLHDQLHEGLTIEAQAPAGTFCLDQRSKRPIVMIAGGIGMTPLLAMLDWLAGVRSGRDIWLFYGTRNSQEHAFRDHLRAIKRSLPNFKQLTFYSQPTSACRKGSDYDAEGHFEVDKIRHLLKARDYEFYICGPEAMMQKVTHDLLGWGVPRDAIATEGFGGTPAMPTASPAAHEPQEAPAPASAPARRLSVELFRSRKTVGWTGRQGTLLELAEACGVNARHSCRAGRCGTCKVALRAGDVEYISQPAVPIEEGACLPCIARPVSDVVVDL